MELDFSYDIEKDAENIIASTKSVNNKELSPVAKLYAEKHGGVFEKTKVMGFVREYLAAHAIDPEAEVVVIGAAWSKIASAFLERTEKLFGIPYPEKVVRVFLTINERCTYSIEKGCFFVKMRSTSPNRTIMHELLHFYTWHAFHERLEAQGVLKERYNDIKESLTELLNVEYADLMDGHRDAGYPQHQEMRANVRRLWAEHGDLWEVVRGLII